METGGGERLRCWFKLFFNRWLFKICAKNFVIPFNVWQNRNCNRLSGSCFHPTLITFNYNSFFQFRSHRHGKRRYRDYLTGFLVFASCQTMLSYNNHHPGPAGTAFYYFSNSKFNPGFLPLGTYTGKDANAAYVR